MTTTFFHDASDVQLFGGQTFNVADNMYFSSAGATLNQLSSRIAAGAIHDSAERCDAPKCQPDTRVAVQDDLYNWIVYGDTASEHPRRIKWVTGPAGSGKTAVMGSLSDRCAADGVLGATFFFASWSASIGRRRKTALVATIAHQLARHREDLKIAISTAIEKNPGVFEKNLHVQMKVLVSTPLREVGRRSGGPRLRGAIIIDGLDECEAEQYHNSTTTSPRSKPQRKNAEDQLEILQVLQAASLDPAFPFRILIASRPERVFREFFDPESNPTSFAPKLDLHKDYNADADIALFLEAEFNLLRRRHNFPPSWPPPGTIQLLVDKASGQFIYAATIMRLLGTGHREPPKALLDAVLKTEATRKTAPNPLEQLDALYSHILSSSPDPPLSVRWIHSIKRLNEVDFVFSPSHPYTSNLHLLLQADPESNEVEHLLGNLHSLIRIPPPSDQATKYDFYHKSLFDFLNDPDRCGELYIQYREIDGFIWDRLNRACARACSTHFSYPEGFREFLTHFPTYVPCSAYSEFLPTSASAGWWVKLAIAHNEIGSIRNIFSRVHDSCSWYRCKPACRIWSRSILRRLGSAAWIAPGMLWPGRGSHVQDERFWNLARKTMMGAVKEGFNSKNHP